MALNAKLIREKLTQKLSQKPELLKELHINNASELSTMSDKQLENLLSPKVLGLLALNKKDLEL